MENYKVYLLRNSIDKKVYIGVTQQDLKRRWKYGNGYKNHSCLFNAIKSIGWDKFEKVELAHGLTKEQAEELEKYYIQVYDSTNESKGYNVQTGGFSKYGSHRFSKIMSDSRKGIIFTEEHKKHLSESHIGHYPTEEQNMKNRMNNPRRKEIICVETKIIYPSIRYAGKATGINYKTIQAVLSGKYGHKTAGGFHWEYVKERR